MDFMIFLLLVVIIYIICIYVLCYQMKCSFRIASREARNSIIEIVKGLFEKTPPQLVRVIGKTENGLFDYDLTISSFESIKNQFEIFILDKKPVEYVNRVHYSFIARYPININDELLVIKFVKEMVYAIIKGSLLCDIDMDINNLIAVDYSIKTGTLVIIIGKNKIGADEIMDINIAIRKQRLKNEIEKEEINDDWK